MTEQPMAVIPQQHLASAGGLADIPRFDALIDSIKKSGERWQQLVSASLTLLYPHDFQDFGGKPYLEAEGARRLCRVGIWLSAPIFERRDIDDTTFIECMVEARWETAGQGATEIGTCNTKDKFWDNEGEHSLMNQCRRQAGGDERIAREMLVGHIKKKAYANAVSRAVTSCMGIHGLTWPDLAALGFSPDKAGVRVAFDGKGKKKAAAPRTGKTAPEAKPPVDPGQVVTIAELLALSIGERAAIEGTILASYNNPKSNKYTIKDDTGTVDVMVWTADPPAAMKGYRVCCTVEVKSYQDRPQYIAEAVEVIQ